MICFAKSVLTEDVICFVKGTIFNNVLYVRCVRLTKAKLIQMRQAHLLVREDVAQGLILVVILQGLGNDWQQTASRNATLTLTEPVKCVPTAIQ
jgi:hypothetical protein